MPLEATATASWWRTAEHYLKEMSTEGSILSYPNVGKELSCRWSVPFWCITRTITPMKSRAISSS